MKNNFIENIYVGLTEKELPFNCITHSGPRFLNNTGLRIYIYYRCKNVIMPITFQDLSDNYISAIEAWMIAAHNTMIETEIINVNDLLNTISKTPAFPHLQMFAVTNKSSSMGAGCIINRKAIHEEIINKTNTTKFILLPSSIHEVILVPCPDNVDINEYSEMVKAVNAEQVLMNERLSEKAYVIDFSKSRR